MPCTDYFFYSYTFGGSAIPSDSFPEFEKRAEEYISAITFGKIDFLNPTDQIKKAICAVADTIYSNNNGGGLTYEKSGDISVGYARGISNTAPPSRALRNTAMQYLADSGILFRGARR
ncbi:MAG: hypothetical protein J5874_03685 [Oscillospiraceae bacterium]|nr:hypothetical protein [Oscillospiraceae bacterium]